MTRRRFLQGTVAAGAVTAVGCVGVKSVATSRTPERAWRKGHYQVHYIYTGRSECMFHIFPDGTSMLLDCGDSMRFYQTPAEVPLPSSPSIRAGEFAAKYILRVNPKGDKVDYLHLSHYHEDHGGGERYNGGPLGKSSLGEFNLCGIADAARFLSRRPADRTSAQHGVPGLHVLLVPRRHLSRV